MTRSQLRIFAHAAALCCVFTVIALPSLCKAATMHIVPSEGMATVGDEFPIDIFIDSEGDSINAVSGSVSVSSPDVVFVAANDAGSPVSLWIKRPSVDESGVISFSGIIPGGYEGNGARIASLIVRGTKPGTRTFSWLSVSMLENDGKGTETAASSTPAKVTFAADATGTRRSTSEAVEDIEPPLPFVPAVARDPHIFGGAYFISFSTTDKGSGIARYEIKEGDGPFAAASSPYQLSGQRLESPIIIAAYDRAGNRRLAVYDPAPGRAWITPGFAVLAGVILLVLYALKKRYLSP